MHDDDVAIVLLAGGEGRRFSDKLEACIEGEPLIVRCFRRLRAAGWPLYVAGKGSFPREVDAALEAPVLIDREPARGPLLAFISACAFVRAKRLFAVAADQPRLDAGVLRRIAESRKDGDDAVVPRHAGGIEPLAALYERAAVLRASAALRRDGCTAMHDLVERISTRFVLADAFCFYNVNRPGDLAAVTI
jgi:molybdenum cofactor guanylyltransferase